MLVKFLRLCIHGYESSLLQAGSDQLLIFFCFIKIFDILVQPSLRSFYLRHFFYFCHTGMYVIFILVIATMHYFILSPGFLYNFSTQ